VAFDATVKVAVEVPEPGAPIDDGLKPTVTPDGAPVALRAMAELNPPETPVVMVEVPLLPWTTESDVGEAEMVKAGFWVVDPVRALKRPALGLPHPVTRS
jgi:hypothetical protein